MTLASDDDGVQEWTSALEPNFYFRGGRWMRQYVVCSTDQMQFATPEDPYNRCTKYGGLASWKRCSECPSNHGIKSMSSSEYPRLNREGCVTQDFTYSAFRGKCRRCWQRAVCVGQQLTRAKRVHLVVV